MTAITDSAAHCKTNSVKGNTQKGFDGEILEKRNRQTL